ncbi:MAG: hypothetical protein OXE85_12545 [Roseovarius sp.]|nr:hypothetical protein [Roseovarius sp.]
MIILLGVALGLATGTFVAVRRKGTVADILQYAFAYCIFFTLVFLFATLIIQRLII